MIDRRTAKRQYKEGQRPMGVFRLCNTRNGKILVGRSVNLPATFNKLRMQLETGSYLMQPKLQQDWRDHGSEAFEFEVLQELEPDDSPDWDPSEDLETLEALWLEELSPFDENGYNRRPKRV